MEACRSGHNGTDLKSAVAHAPGVRIPLPPPLNINLHSKVPIIGSIPKITGWLLLSAGLTYNKMHKVVPIQFNEKQEVGGSSPSLHINNIKCGDNSDGRVPA